MKDRRERGGLARSITISGFGSRGGGTALLRVSRGGGFGGRRWGLEGGQDIFGGMKTLTEGGFQQLVQHIGQLRADMMGEGGGSVANPSVPPTMS